MCLTMMLYCKTSSKYSGNHVVLFTVAISQQYHPWNPWDWYIYLYQCNIKINHSRMYIDINFKETIWHQNIPKKRWGIFSQQPNNQESASKYRTSAPVTPWHFLIQRFPRFKYFADYIRHQRVNPSLYLGSFVGRAERVIF